VIRRKEKAIKKETKDYLKKRGSQGHRKKQ
jgi:hypothetical protein